MSPHSTTFLKLEGIYVYMVYIPQIVIGKKLCKFAELCDYVSASCHLIVLLVQIIAAIQKAYVLCKTADVISSSLQ